MDVGPEAEDGDDPKQMELAYSSCFDIGEEGGKETHAGHGSQVGPGVEVMAAIKESE